MTRKGLAAVAVAAGGGALAWWALEAPDAPCLPPGLVAGPTEYFDAGDLYRKIDGRAETYLSAGFRGLRCTRFSLEDDAETLFEACEYDMGSSRAAFAMLTLQRREDADAHDDELGYDVRDGSSFFVHGPLYVEALVGSPGVSAGQAVRRFREVCHRDPSEPPERTLPESVLLPSEGRLPSSLVLLPTSAFGFDGLDGVVAAAYGESARGAFGFVSVRDDAAEAERLAAEYVAFLVENGGRTVQGGPDLHGATVVEVLQAYDVVFSRGRVLAGVHDAPDIESASRLAASVERAVLRHESR